MAKNLSTKILDASGQPWQPSPAQLRRLANFDSPFKGASYSRKAGALWRATEASADTEVIAALPVLRARSRELVRNSPIAKGSLQTLLNSVVGQGLKANPKIDFETLGITEESAQAIEKSMDREWRLWSSSIECDLNRMTNFNGLQQLAFHSAMESGDLLTLLPMFRRPGSTYQTKVQLVESDRISNPNNLLDTPTMVGGVELDGNGAPVAYHARRAHPGDISFTGANTWQRVEAFGANTGRRNSWLLFKRLRPGQNRGLPYFTVVMEQLKQLERYTDAELMAAVINGIFTVFVKTESGDMLPIGSELTGPGTENNIELDYGSIVELNPGESIETAKSDRPNRNFGDFVTSILQQVGAGLGLPFELLIKNFTSSYSASRAALLEAWNFFKAERNWFALGFCQPVYAAVITEAVLLGRLNLPGFMNNPLKRQAYLGVNWIGPSQSQIDPTKEAEAAKMRIEAGLSTLEDEAPAISGRDWEEIHRQRAREKRMRMQDGLEVNNNVE